MRSRRRVGRRNMASKAGKELGQGERKKKWIKGAIKHPGSLRKALGAKKGKPIPVGKLRAAAAKGGTLGRRARLAITLKKMH